MSREQQLQSEKYETKLIKIYFKEVHYKSLLKKSFLPIFEVLRQNIKTFPWCLVIESLMVKELGEYNFPGIRRNFVFYHKGVSLSVNELLFTDIAI